MVKFELTHGQIGEDVVAVRVVATVMFREVSTLPVFFSHYLINWFEVKGLTT